MAVHRSLAALGAVTAAGLLTVTATAPASAASSVHTAKVKKGPYTAGTIRVDEAGDKVTLCDTPGVKGYLTAYYYWGTGTFKAQLTDNWHRGCTYSSASGAGAAKKIDMPEGKTITIRVLNQIGNGRSDAIEILTFKNDH
ncbi:hypothetical protein ACFYZ5_43780 [Streptomyces chartreusis]|uniref:hypothetical protein n=1 Tax=Streptomyces chartreusis TaxID=1969 RepID=UPI0036CA44C4